jgi:hypothetical protein
MPRFGGVIGLGAGFCSLGVISDGKLATKTQNKLPKKVKAVVHKKYPSLKKGK